MLNLLANWLEISFISNVNILIGIMLGSNDFFESSEDITFYISDLMAGLRKKELWVLFFRKSEKWLLEGFIFSFAFSEIAKWLLKIFKTSLLLVMVKPLEDKLFRISEVWFLIGIRDFIISKYWLWNIDCNNLICFFKKVQMTYLCNLYISYEKFLLLVNLFP